MLYNLPQILMYTYWHIQQDISIMSGILPAKIKFVIIL